jgi:hypothetical protein
MSVSPKELLPNYVPFVCRYRRHFATCRYRVGREHRSAQDSPSSVSVAATSAAQALPVSRSVDCWGVLLLDRMVQLFHSAAPLAEHGGG